MKLTVQRIIKEDNHTTGALFLDGKYFCDTMEDKDRGLYSYMNIGEISNIKIKAQTAIPYGTYKMRISYSPRFKKDLPEILNVPGFTGVRIHSGNTQDDTEGCILVGEKNGSGTSVLNSRKTFDKLFAILKKETELEIEII
jgi:hypothetical protein